MHKEQIDLDESHIRLITDLEKNNLKNYIKKIRYDLKQYITKNQDFLISLEPLKMPDENLPLIVKKMYESSNIADVGPMAAVAGSISEMSLNYLIKNNSTYSIVENGGDIAIINDKPVICGIYSNNELLGNKIAFKLKSRKKALGLCTSSCKIGHSISFGQSDSLTVISNSSSISDALATRIANDVNGNNGENKISKALETCENYKEYFDGVLIISGKYIGTIGKLPKIIESKEFKVDI